MSRAAIEGSVRTLFAFVQIKEKADYALELQEDMKKSILNLEEAMGIFTIS